LRQGRNSAFFNLVFLILAILSAGNCFALDFSVFVVRGFEGKGPLEFNYPEDLLITEDGRIIVADQKNNRLQVLGKDGDFIRFIPQLQQLSESADEAEKIANQKNFEELQNQLKKPAGLAMDKDGRLYVSCQDTNQILIIDFESGKLLGKLGKTGKGQGQLRSPMDIDVDSSGRIAVAEWRNQRVQILDQNGKCLKEIIYNEETKRGYKPVSPRGVFWTVEGKLLVTYPLFNQVVCWNVDNGELLWRYGIKGSDRGMLHNPSYITNSTDGRFLISDTLNHRLVEISRDGKYYQNYNVRKGSAPGRLISPRGIMLNKEGTLVIADQGNNRIHFFQPGQATLMLREVKELALKDDWQSAMPKIERILYLQPNNSQARELMVNALYYFGDKAFAEGEYLKAEENFRRVLRYRPDDPNIPEKLDAIFWASNQGLIANVVFGIIAIVVALILIWILKVIVYRFILSRK
jgi:sugar lactone lactonase YvrE